MRSALTLASVLVSLLVAGSAAAASRTVWTPHQAGAFVVSLPMSWQVIPASRKATGTLAVRLRGQGQAALARAYASFYKDDFQWEPAPPVFHAFQWPMPPSAISTDVLVRAYPAGGVSLAQIVPVLASELVKSGGMKVSRPVHLDGTAENCYRIEARAKLGPSYGAQASYNLVYVYGNGKRFYELIVRGEAGLGGSYRAVANRVAASLQFA